MDVVALAVLVVFGIVVMFFAVRNSASSKATTALPVDAPPTNPAIETAPDEDWRIAARQREEERKLQRGPDLTGQIVKGVLIANLITGIAGWILYSLTMH